MLVVLPFTVTIKRPLSIEATGVATALAPVDNAFVDNWPLFTVMIALSLIATPCKSRVALMSVDVRPVAMLADFNAVRRKWSVPMVFSRKITC